MSLQIRVGVRPKARDYPAAMWRFRGTARLEPLTADGASCVDVAAQRGGAVCQAA